MKTVLTIIALTVPMLVSAAEILDPSVGPGEGRAAVSVERNSHLGTNGRQAFIFVDGKAVATLKGSEAVVIHLSPGVHIMGATLRSKPDKPDHSIAVDAKLGETTMLQAHLGNWGWSGMELKRIN